MTYYYKQRVNPYGYIYTMRKVFWTLIAALAVDIIIVLIGLSFYWIKFG